MAVVQILGLLYAADQIWRTSQKACWRNGVFIKACVSLEDIFGCNSGTNYPICTIHVWKLTAEKTLNYHTAQSNPTQLCHLVKHVKLKFEAILHCFPRFLPWYCMNDYTIPTVYCIIVVGNNYEVKFSVTWILCSSRKENGKKIKHKCMGICWCQKVVSWDTSFWHWLVWWYSSVLVLQKGCTSRYDLLGMNYSYIMKNINSVKRAYQELHPFWTYNLYSSSYIHCSKKVSLGAKTLCYKYFKTNIRIFYVLKWLNWRCVIEATSTAMGRMN